MICVNRPLRVTAWCVGAALANGGLNHLASVLGLPLFLDTTFTIVVAALFGPVAGGLTGLGSNIANEVFAGLPGYMLAFAPLNVASGLIVGAMRVTGRFETVGDAITALVTVSLVNAAAGALIVGLLYGGGTHEPIDLVVASLVLSGRSVWMSAFLARIPVNFVDKAPGIIVALMMVRMGYGAARRVDQPQPGI